jgi:hypothetical protein
MLCDAWTAFSVRIEGTVPFNHHHSFHYYLMQRSQSSSLRPRTAPIDRAEALLTLTSSVPTITSPASTRNSVKGPGARLHGHQSYFGAHRQRNLIICLFEILRCVSSLF